jgi:hypothetical protein
MPKTKISEFSATPANNTDIDSINIAEGCAPSGINDAIRELMAQLKDFQTGAVGDSFNGPVGSSTAAAGAFTTLSASSTLAVTGVATLTAQPILSSLTASRAVFTDASKGLVSNAITGTGNVVMSTSPTLVTPVLGAATGTSFQGIIGNVTPAAGAFTTVDASGAVTLSGGTANGVTYLNGSKVLTSGSALTFDGTKLGINTSSPVRTLSIANGGPVVEIDPAGGTAGPIYFNYNRSTATYLTPEYWALAHIWNVSGGTEAMRLTSTGLGIGTSSPSSKLDIRATNPTVTVKATSTGYPYAYFSNDGGDFYIGRDSSAGAAFANANANVVWGVGANPILFATNNTVRATLDASGNLGLGVTPSAWITAASARALQFNGGSVWSYSTDRIAMIQNAYLDTSGDYRYVATDAASQYRLASGVHAWFNAPSGSAGAVATLTQAMTLDASGNLGLGTTSIVDISGGSGKTLEIYGGSQGGFLHLTNSTTGQTVSDGFIIGTAIGGSDALLIQRENANMIFRTNDTERARIDSSGNLLVGTTSTLSGGKITLSFDGSTQNGLISSTSTDASNAVFAGWNVGASNIGTVSRVATTSAVVYNTTSDYRLKTVTGTVTGQGARIDALKPIDYVWTEGGQQARGFLAHEFQEVYSNSVTGDKDAVDADGNPKYQSMQASSSEVIADLVAEIQSLRQRLSAANL